MAAVIAFPRPPREPNWALIDAVAAGLGLWDDTPPPPRPVLRLVR